MSGRVRALVVDDSPTARALLCEILASDPGIDVVGEAVDGEEAVRKVLALRPSIVVMDIEMPRLSGLEATGRIMAEAPTPIVIVTARHDPRDVALTLDATRLGALTVLPKPPGPGSPTFRRDVASLVSLVKALSDVKVIGRRGVGARPVRRAPVPVEGRTIEVVGVAASTGGPAAVYRFLSALPADLTVPVLVVQHITEGFVSGLVRWLDRATPLEVRLAADGEPLRGGTVYVAPDGRHLELTRDRHVRLGDGAPTGGFRPSASNLFSSLACAYGAHVAAVVLTGMGTDGLEGARAVHAGGGLVLAQDAPTSAVFGMPRAVIDAGLADVVAPVEGLAHAISSHLPEGQP